MAKLVAKGAALVPELVAAAKPKLAKFVKYAKVELTPPTPAELPQVVRGFGDLGRAIRQRKYREMTVMEFWISTCVAVEITCWFWVGECIGKGSISGYRV